MFSVLIVGCGPTGLVAAEAAKQSGARVHIAAKKRKSQLFGCQYLHAEIPGITGRPVEVDYQLQGTIDGYREKVYGSDWRGSVSADELNGQHLAWDIRRAYEIMWNRWEDHIVDGILTPGDVPDMLDYFGRPDFVFSSIPAPALCLRSEHEFELQTIYAIGDAPELNIWCPVRPKQLSPNVVVCNGEPEPSWYRLCEVFGHVTCEWPFNRKPPYEGVAEVEKPLTTNCTCYPDIARIGRYGAWQKGWLVHEAWDVVTKTLTAPRQGELFNV